RRNRRRRWPATPPETWCGIASCRCRIPGRGPGIRHSIGRDLIKTAAVAIEPGRLAGECLPTFDDDVAEGLRQFEAIDAAAGLLAGDQLRARTGERLVTDIARS